MPWRWKDNLIELTDMRIIKKYPNRRLYDTEISRYITLDDVRKLVLDGVEFCVTDVKSEEDLTRSVLLQIISEQEHEGKPIFNTPMLTQLIRFLRQRLPVRIQRLFAEKPGNVCHATTEHPEKLSAGRQQQSFCHNNERDHGAEHGSMAATAEQLFQDDGFYRFRPG